MAAHLFATPDCVAVECCPKASRVGSIRGRMRDKLQSSPVGFTLRVPDLRLLSDPLTYLRIFESIEPQTS